jgi:hypothetical protein
MERHVADLPDDTIVIRGGENKLKDVQKSAREALEDCGIYMLSANADPKMTFDVLARAANHPHPSLSRTTVGRLRKAKCRVTRPGGKHRHVSIITPQPPTDDDWRLYEQAFDPPEENPHRRRAK